MGNAVKKISFNNKGKERDVLIVFDSGFSQLEQKKAEDSLKRTLTYIDNHPDSSKLLEQYLASGKPFFLTNSDDSFYTRFKSGQWAIMYNPNRAYINYDKKGKDRKINGVVSAASILVHELRHAIDFQNIADPRQHPFKKIPDADNDPYDNYAEERARDAANKFRDFYGEPIRIDRETLGESIDVDDPTYSMKVAPTYYDNVNKLVDDFIHQDWDNLFRNPLLRQYDPLTLDLDGNGIETLASNGHKGALFDHDKNGIRTATGWVGKDDGFLVYDRNGDGVVNDGGELFGDNTLLKNGERATNGYQALADLDDNGDGKVDAADSAFAKLRVWRDLNQDGISQQGELLTLDEARVKALTLTNNISNRDLGNGNSLAEEGTYTDSDGNKKQMGDLNLAADHFHSRYADSLPLTDEQQQAPNLRGSGRVRDLREAAARSPELAEALQQYKNAATKEEQLTLRHENTAMTPGKPCHEYAEKDRLKALQGCNKSVQFPQNTTQTPHNNTWICRNNQHSRTSHDKPTDQYRPQAAASCSVSCLWYCPTLGLQ